MKEIIVATTNKGKISEITLALEHLALHFISLQSYPNITPAVEDGHTFAENAMIKAAYYANITGKPCLADDSGLEVDALNGAPGVYSARFAGESASDEDNNRLLLKKMATVPEKQRQARFRCVIALADGDRVISAEGTCEGRVLREGCGQGGFGYDPLFYIPSLGKTLAEVTQEEKNQVSHRGQALRNLEKKLRGTFL